MFPMDDYDMLLNAWLINNRGLEKIAGIVIKASRHGRKKLEKHIIEVGCDRTICRL